MEPQHQSEVVKHVGFIFLFFFNLYFTPIMFAVTVCYHIIFQSVVSLFLPQKVCIIQVSCEHCFAQK